MNTKFTQISMVLVLAALTACSSAKIATEKKVAVIETSDLLTERVIAVIGGEGKYLAEFASNALRLGATKEAIILKEIGEIAAAFNRGVGAPLKTVNDLYDAFSKEDAAFILQKFKETGKYAKVFESEAGKLAYSNAQKSAAESRIGQPKLGAKPVADANTGKLAIPAELKEYARRMMQTLADKSMARSLIGHVSNIYSNTGLMWSNSKSCSNKYSQKSLQNKDAILKEIADQAEASQTASCMINRGGIAMVNGLTKIGYVAEKTTQAALTDVEATVGALCASCNECPLETPYALRDMRVKNGGEYPALSQACN